MAVFLDASTENGLCESQIFFHEGGKVMLSRFLRSLEALDRERHSFAELDSRFLTQSRQADAHFRTLVP